MEVLYKGRYQRYERVGSGAFGVIYKVKSLPEGKTLIAKHIPLFNVEKSKALQEVPTCPYSLKFYKNSNTTTSSDTKTASQNRTSSSSSCSTAEVAPK